MITRWTRQDTIQLLRAARRGIGIAGFLEIAGGLAVFAICAGFLERALG